MESQIDKEPNQEATTSEPPVRKGRRGLARKKTGPTPSPDVSSISTHNTSVYSSCVSRGFQNIFGAIGAEEEKCDKTGDNANDIDGGAGGGINVPEMGEDISPIEKPCDEESKDRLVEGTATLSEDESCVDNEVEYVESTEAVVAGMLRSPTPPPHCQGPTQGKKRRMNKKLKSALNTLNKAKDNLDLTPSTPFTKSRRGRKVVDTTNTDAALLLVENTPIKTEMVVKVRYLSSIHRVQFKLTDPFYKLLTHLSQSTGQQEQHLSLFLHDQALALAKTPKEVGLTVADIIECHCMKDVEGERRGNEEISVLIQCSNSKRKTEMKATKRQPLNEVLETYAKQVGIDASTVRFCFDGEDVGPSDTALNLELEDGDILDLVPATAHKSRRSSSLSRSVITIL